MTPNSPGLPITFPNSSTKKPTMKPIKQVDKSVKYMKEVYGTTCLITEAGVADKLLELGHKRRINKERLVDRPMDSWEI